MVDLRNRVRTALLAVEVQIENLGRDHQTKLEYGGSPRDRQVRVLMESGSEVGRGSRGSSLILILIPPLFDRWQMGIKIKD